MEKYFYFAFIRVFRLFLFSNGKKAANKFYVVSSGVYELLVDRECMRACHWQSLVSFRNRMEVEWNPEWCCFHCEISSTKAITDYGSAHSWFLNAKRNHKINALNMRYELASHCGADVCVCARVFPPINNFQINIIHSANNKQQQRQVQR